MGLLSQLIEMELTRPQTEAKNAFATSQLEEEARHRAWVEQNPWAQNFNRNAQEVAKAWTAMNQPAQKTPRQQGWTTRPGQDPLQPERGGNFVIDLPGGPDPTQYQAPELPANIKDMVLGIDPKSRILGALASRLEGQPALNGLPAPAGGPTPSPVRMLTTAKPPAPVEGGGLGATVAAQVDPFAELLRDPGTRIAMKAVGLDPSAGDLPVRWERAQDPGSGEAVLVPVVGTTPDFAKALKVPPEYSLTERKGVDERGRPTREWWSQKKGSQEAQRVSTEPHPDLFAPAPADLMQRLAEAGLRPPPGLTYGQALGFVDSAQTSPARRGRLPARPPSLMPPLSISGGGAGTMPSSEEKARRETAARIETEQNTRIADSAELLKWVDENGNPPTGNWTVPQLQASGKYQLKQPAEGGETVMKLRALVPEARRGLQELKTLLFPKGMDGPVNAGILKQTLLVPVNENSLVGGTVSSLEKASGALGGARRVRQAQKLVVEIIGRLLSGGVINPQEQSTFMQIYAPAAGDPDEIIKEKIQGLERFYAAVEKQTDPNDLIKSVPNALLMPTGKGARTSVAPAAGGPQRIVNPKTGQSAVLKGGKWVDESTGKPIMGGK